MGLRVYNETFTCTAASESFNTSERITGRIMKVQIACSASTEVAIWIDASDTNTSAVVDEFIVGSSVGSNGYITVNTTTTLYPGIELFNTDLATPATFDPDNYTHYVVDDVLEVGTSAAAAADTVQVAIWYDDFAKHADQKPLNTHTQ